MASQPKESPWLLDEWEEEVIESLTAILLDFLFACAISNDREINHGIRQVDVMQKLRVPIKEGKTNNNGKNIVTPMKRKDMSCSGLSASSGSQSSTPQVRSVTNSQFACNYIRTFANSFLSLIARGSASEGNSRRKAEEKEAGSKRKAEEKPKKSRSGRCERC